MSANETGHNSKNPKKDRLLLWIVSGAIGLALLALMLLPALIRERPLTDSQAAKDELTSRLEKVFAQRFSIATDGIIVDLGSEDSITQLENKKAEKVTVVLSAKTDEAAAIIAEVAGLQKQWVTVNGGYARIGAGFDVPFMGNLNVGVTQKVSSSDGAVSLAPEGFYMSGLKVPASELVGIPMVGDWVKQFTTTQNHCIVDRVPAGFELTQSTVNGSALEMTFTGENVSLDLAELQKTGNCS